VTFALSDDPVLPAEPFGLPDGPVLAVRRAHGPLRPFLLVHDAGRDARDWNQVGTRLSAAGHEVAAADLRGHGASEAPGSGYDTDTCADDLATLIELLGFTGGRSPIVVGCGWGANVAASLAARRDGVAALACLDGGWMRPARSFPDVDAYRAAVVPPAASDVVRAVHESLYRGEPRAWFPLIRVPVLFGPVVTSPAADPVPADADTRAGVEEVAVTLGWSRVAWYLADGGTAPLPVAQAARVTDDLLDLALNAEPAVAGS
jgi:pimeloyl-ACP methyl ester carboxylesterase